MFPNVQSNASLPSECMLVLQHVSIPWCSDIHHLQWVLLCIEPSPRPGQGDGDQKGCHIGQERKLCGEITLGLYRGLQQWLPPHRESCQERRRQGYVWDLQTWCVVAIDCY